MLIRNTRTAAMDRGPVASIGEGTERVGSNVSRTVEIIARGEEGCSGKLWESFCDVDGAHHMQLLVDIAAVRDDQHDHVLRGVLDAVYHAPIPNALPETARELAA